LAAIDFVVLAGLPSANTNMRYAPDERARIGLDIVQRFIWQAFTWK
jgi:hypothetical protein